MSRGHFVLKIKTIFFSALMFRMDVSIMLRMEIDTNCIESKKRSVTSPKNIAWLVLHNNQNYIQYECKPITIYEVLSLSVLGIFGFILGEKKKKTINQHKLYCRFPFRCKGVYPTIWLTVTFHGGKPYFCSANVASMENSTTDFTFEYECYDCPIF